MAVNTEIGGPAPAGMRTAPAAGRTAAGRSRAWSRSRHRDLRLHLHERGEPIGQVETTEPDPLCDDVKGGEVGDLVVLPEAPSEEPEGLEGDDGGKRCHQGRAT